MIITKVVILGCFLRCISVYVDRDIGLQAMTLKVPCVWNGHTKLCWCWHSKDYHRNHTDCSGQNLNYIPKLPNYTTSLNFNNNDLTTLTSDMLVNISTKHLRQLKMQSNNMSDIEEGLFSVFKQLRVLDLSHNPLLTYDILLNSFSGISKSMRSLYLNNVTLPTFSDQFFLPFKDSDLQFIQLHYNHIRLFNSNRLFEYLPNLDGLDLSWNFLKSAFFTESTSLSYLYLSYNDLTTFPEFCKNETSAYFPSLKRLYLDRNCLSTLQMLKVECLENLELFNVSETRINTLHTDTFKHLKSLETISLENIASFIRIQPFAFRSKTVQNISLKGNYLEFKTADVDIKDVFAGCPQLKKLDISGNSLQRLTTHDWEIMFSNIPKLEYMNVSNSGLLYIPKSWPIVIPHLIGLDVGNNHINHIPTNYFEPFKKMKFLIMGRNQFTSFQEWELPKNLESLNLIQNPFICDCDLMWFSKFVKRNHAIMKHYPRGYTCRGINKTISSLEFRKGACSISHEISSIIATTCIILIILLLVLAIVYRYRWRLRYVCYLFTYHKRQINMICESDYQNDIFVSCAQEQYDVVLESIVKRLEERESYRVFITERNVLPSESKMGKTLASLDKSRYFMICLSNNFCEDQWCEFETNMAMQKTMYENVGSVIVVLLEEISIENMNKQLWWLVRNDEYLFWDEDEDACELFWIKLRSRLNSHNSNDQNIPMAILNR